MEKYNQFEYYVKGEIIFEDVENKIYYLCQYNKRNGQTIEKEITQKDYFYYQLALKECGSRGIGFDDYLNSIFKL